MEPWQFDFFCAFGELYFQVQRILRRLDNALCSLPCKALLSLRNTSNRGPIGILCTRGEKEYASIRQPTVACDNRLVKREAYDASPGRVTLLSSTRKILYSGPRRDTVYPLGKGVCERKTDICRLRRLSGQE